MKSHSGATNRIEVHDPDTLGAARAVLDACTDARAMGEAVKAAVERNARWRGEQCINLLAPEAPTSPAVRALLSSDGDVRALTERLRQQRARLAAELERQASRLRRLEALQRAIESDPAAPELSVRVRPIKAIKDALA